jgi:hypothetical protein
MKEEEKIWREKSKKVKKRKKERKDRNRKKWVNTERETEKIQW